MDRHVSHEWLGFRRRCQSGWHLVCRSYNACSLGARTQLAPRSHAGTHATGTAAQAQPPSRPAQPRACAFLWCGRGQWRGRQLTPQHVRQAGGGGGQRLPQRKAARTEAEEVRGRAGSSGHSQDLAFHSEGVSDGSLGRPSRRTPPWTGNGGEAGGKVAGTVSFPSACAAAGGPSAYRDGVEGSAGPWGEGRAADARSGVPDNTSHCSESHKGQPVGHGHARGFLLRV